MAFLRLLSLPTEIEDSENQLCLHPVDPKEFFYGSEIKLAHFSAHQASISTQHWTGKILKAILL